MTLIFSLLLGILLLPLRLASLALRLALLPLKFIPLIFTLAWLPVALITRNLFVLILVIVVLVIYIIFKNSDGKLENLTPSPAPVVQMQNAPGNGRAPVIEAVRKQEDGDSAFATDLYATMTTPERGYYSTIFFWAMANLPNGQSHSWNNGNIAGTIRPTDTFKNNSGTTCRHFSEALKVHAIQQTLTGTACDDGSGVWCKLKPNATPACGLGHQPDALEDLKRSLGL